MELAMQDRKIKFLIKKIIVIYCFLIFAVSLAYCQKNEFANKNKNLDTSEYEKHQQSGAFLFKLANGDNVYQERLAYGGFYERVEENASAYGTYSEYYNNGKLKKRCRTFYGFMIGIQYNYDDTGNVISSKDFDSNYKFTTDDLVLKIKQTYHVNILDRSLRIIVARSNNSKPIYGIGIPVDCDYGNCFREIDIDGTNGEILSDKIKVYPIK